MTATRAELRIADNLALPVDAVTQTVGILAKRGVGKTYTGAVFAEELLKAGQVVAIIDPVGVWYGLRASADGKGPGLPITVLGGEHGDLPIPLDSGAAIADLLVDERIPLVLDLSGFRKGEMIRWATAFFERLYHRNRQPLHVILDEADAFAPQKPLGDEARMLGAVEDLVRRGRARGIGVTLITQRAAVINKNVLTQIEVLVVLRTIGPQDRKAIDEWIAIHGTPEQRQELMASLASLAIGEAWFWSPGRLDLFLRIQVRRRETFDSSATPKAGQVRAAPKQLAPVDLERLTARLGEAIEKARAEDPRALRQRIVELERQLAQRPPPATRIERVEVPVVPPAHRAALTLTAGQLVDHLKTIATAVQGLADATANLQALVRDLEPAPAADAVLAPVTPIARPAAPARPAIAPPPAPAAAQVEPDPPEGGPSQTELFLLRLVLRHVDRPLTGRGLVVIAGLNDSGGFFRRTMAALRRRELVTMAADQTIEPTAAARALVPGVGATPATTFEILGRWRARLTPAEMRMLETLVDVYPASLAKEELGARLDQQITGGFYRRNLAKLRRNALVDDSGKEVRASDLLFIAQEV